ncbi:MAG TPA: TetR family transcriptional regulator [Pseudonocardiaceae bacterium]
MDHGASFFQRVRGSLREELLDAAAELLAERGFHGLRMAEVARVVGVSRQTVHNEFGTKEALAQAVALRTTAGFLEEVDACLRAAPDLVSGVRDAVGHVLRHAGENRLVAAILGTPEAQDLLPFLTTRGEPVLRPATEALAVHLRRYRPDLAPERAATVAEVLVRLTLSHLVLPGTTPERAADTVAEVVAAMLDARPSPGVGAATTG